MKYIIKILHYIKYNKLKSILVIIALGYIFVAISTNQFGKAGSFGVILASLVTISIVFKEKLKELVQFYKKL